MDDRVAALEVAADRRLADVAAHRLELAGRVTDRREIDRDDPPDAAVIGELAEDDRAELAGPTGDGDGQLAAALHERGAYQVARSPGGAARARGAVAGLATGGDGALMAEAAGAAGEEGAVAGLAGAAVGEAVERAALDHFAAGEARRALVLERALLAEA